VTGRAARGSRRRRGRGRRRKPARPPGQTSSACEASDAEGIRREGPRGFVSQPLLSTAVSGALARRGGVRGARSTATKERAPQLHACQDAEAVPAPQRRVGGADASAEKRPGAALARDDAGPRSAGSEHRRRVRRRVRESRGQAIQRPRGARTARPRRCRPSSARPQGSPQRASAKRRRCPGGARGRREATRSASCPPAPAQ